MQNISLGVREIVNSIMTMVCDGEDSFRLIESKNLFLRPLVAIGLRERVKKVLNANQRVYMEGDDAGTLQNILNFSVHKRVFESSVQTFNKKSPWSEYIIYDKQSRLPLGLGMMEDDSLGKVHVKVLVKFDSSLEKRESFYREAVIALLMGATNFAFMDIKESSPITHVVVKPIEPDIEMKQSVLSELFGDDRREHSLEEINGIIRVASKTLGRSGSIEDM